MCTPRPMVRHLALLLTIVAAPLVLASAARAQVPCDIKGPESACSPVELCGPEGDFTYAWTKPDGSTDDGKCILADQTGTYTLEVTSGGKSETCTHRFELEECTVNCPRTVGFWTQQCAQKGNGSTKLTLVQLGAITDWIDDDSDFFDWVIDVSGFCAVIDPPRPMDVRKQAARQFAAFLANLASGDLDIETSNGEFPSLDPETPVTCDGEDTTLGDLADDIDELLDDLSDEDLTDEDVKDAYGDIISCLDAINNGIGIGPVCDGDPKKELGGLIDTDVMSPFASEATGRAFPNPFSTATQMSYSVPVTGADVAIGVYDVSGRMVRRLANGFQPAGRYQIEWDGTTDRGETARAGMYFIRGLVGEQRLAARVLYVQ